MDPTYYDSVVENLAECCLQEMKVSDALLHWTYLSHRHPSILTSERLAECFLLMGDLSASHSSLQECRMEMSTKHCEEEIRTQIRATEEAVNKCNEELSEARQWLALNQPEKAIGPLLSCRECAPFWRTPFLLLLRCYVKCVKTDEAYALVQDACPWLRHIELKHKMPTIPLSTPFFSELSHSKEVDESLVG